MIKAQSPVVYYVDLINFCKLYYNISLRISSCVDNTGDDTRTASQSIPININTLFNGGASGLSQFSVATSYIAVIADPIHFRHPGQHVLEFIHHQKLFLLLK